jgi:hypothetical protein
VLIFGDSNIGKPSRRVEERDTGSPIAVLIVEERDAWKP